LDADEVQHVDDLTVGRHGAARGENDREHGRDDDQVKTGGLRRRWSPP
jgi:hypothetical protein